jgi:tetratricopeptide (TPR) repeat protein
MARLGGGDGAATPARREDGDVRETAPERPPWLRDEAVRATEQLARALGPPAAAVTTGTAVLATTTDGVDAGDPSSPAAVSPTRPATPASVVRAATDAVPGVDELRVAAADGDPDAVAAVLDSFTTDGERRGALAAVVDAFPAARAPDADGDLRDRLVGAVDADDHRDAVARVLALRALACSRPLHDRLESWCDLPSTRDDTRDEAARAYRALERDLSTAVVPPALDEAGFVALSPLYFADGPALDPVTYWHTGFTLRAVEAGLAHRFEDVEADLLAALRSDGDRVVVGAPGTGKSTLCRGVAVRWYTADHGTVLYGDQVTGDGDLDGFAAAIDEGRGHVLVVVDGLEGAPGGALATLVDRYRDDDAVSFLFEAERAGGDATDDHADPEGRTPLAAVLDAGVERFEPPALDADDVAGLVETFERTTGDTVTADPETLLDQVRSGAGDTQGGDAVRLAYRLVTEAGESAAGMQAAVADAYEHVQSLADAEGRLVADVALLVNTLTAAGLPVARSVCHTLVADPEAVDDAIDRLDGTVLFVGEDALEPNHGVWAALYLRELVETTDDRTAHERFARVCNALFGVFDPETRERVERDGDGDVPGALAPAASLLSSLVTLGVRWPVLAPLYGTAEDSALDPPDVCSANTIASLVADRGDMYFERGETDRALAEYEAAWALVADDQSMPGPLRERNRAAYESNRGKVAERRGEFDAAADYYERALDRYRALDDRRGTAGVLSQLGQLELKRGAFDDAQARFEDCVEIYSELGAHRETALALNDLGITAWERGDVAAAEDYLTESLAANRRLRDRRGAADCLHKLGMVDWQRGEYDDARTKYERALRIRRSLGNRRDQAATLNGLGNVALEVGNVDRARECFEEALEGFRAIGDEHGESAVITSLGTLEIDCERYEAATEHLEDACELFERLGDESRLAEAENNLGMAAMKRGDLAAAERHFHASLEHKRGVDDERGTANTLTNLGRLARRRGDLDEAREHHERALEHFRATENTRGVGECLTDLAQVERAAGDDETALRYFEDGVERLLDVGSAEVVEQLDETVACCLDLDRQDRAEAWCERAVAALDGEDAARFERRLERLRP